MKILQAVIFDWGDTVMRDFPGNTGSMAYWPKVEIIAGVDQVLDHLHKYFICCLASNAGDSNSELMAIALSRVDLRQHFDYLFTSRELNVKKPDPMFYREILRRLMLEPEECVVIGNDYHKDIIPAKIVGMITIWLTGNLDPTVAPCADYLIDSMDKSVAVVEKISGGGI
jgi:HAD superfamily hydrolase (TIGR01509 family)